MLPELKSLLLRDWNTIRLIRVGLGLLALTFGTLRGEAVIVTVGLLVLLQGLFNLSCSGSCSVPQPSKRKQKISPGHDQ